MPNSKCKVIKKVVAKEFFQYCENFSKLELGQIEDYRKRSAVDTVAIPVHTVQKK